MESQHTFSGARVCVRYADMRRMDACHISWTPRVLLWGGDPRKDATDERTGLAGGAVPGGAAPAARGRLPDAGVDQRGRRRRAGGLATAQWISVRRDREPVGLANHRRRSGVVEHAAFPGDA